MTDKHPQWKIKIAAVFVICIGCLIVIEGLSRAALYYKEEIKMLPGVSYLLRKNLELDPYEMLSPQGGYHWVLRPGYVSSLAELRQKKQRQGKFLGAKALADRSQLKNRPRPSYLRINKDGFRGPEIDRTHSRLRILTLGDSTTFGLGRITYPRVMEHSLNEAGHKVEIINGGVEGYSPVNLVYELERYKQLEPDIVTIFIGWNSIVSDVSPDLGIGRYFRVVRLVRLAWGMAGRLLRDPKKYAAELYNRPLKPNKNDPLIRALDGYVYSSIKNVASIVDELKAAGSQVVLMTLPGLFIMDEDPSAKALAIGHLPAYSINPFVIAKLTKGYNEALRSLADSGNLNVIDLEKWSLKEFQPRASYFSDSVHIAPRALEQLGIYIAEQLAPVIKKVNHERF